MECAVCHKQFNSKFTTHYEVVCPECQKVKGGCMTEEELREKIADLFIQELDMGSDFMHTEREVADMVLGIIREAGWKSGEEFVRCPVCGEEYSAN